ncbi:hypothetical protein ABZ863_06075 [Saccharomonospora sp. NPDC046836]|uniref:hypothetical protein n=1 Tax=Saccharomonospora sp. NPDC046836 TaxID=3156921 RepID=UPI0033F4ECEA
MSDNDSQRQPSDQELLDQYSGQTVAPSWPVEGAKLDMDPSSLRGCATNFATIYANLESDAMGPAQDVKGAGKEIAISLFFDEGRIADRRSQNNADAFLAGLENLKQEVLAHCSALFTCADLAELNETVNLDMMRWIYDTPGAEMPDGLPSYLAEGETIEDMMEEAGIGDGEVPTEEQLYHGALTLGGGMSGPLGTQAVLGQYGINLASLNLPQGAQGAIYRTSEGGIRIMVQGESENAYTQYYFRDGARIYDSEVEENGNSTNTVYDADTGEVAHEIIETNTSETNGSITHHTSEAVRRDLATGETTTTSQHTLIRDTENNLQETLTYDVDEEGNRHNERYIPEQPEPDTDFTEVYEEAEARNEELLRRLG